MIDRLIISAETTNEYEKLLADKKLSKAEKNQEYQ